MKRLTLLSRPECELCEKLLDELVPLVGAQAEVEVVDISEDPALLLEYGSRIPILIAAGTELSGYPLEVERVKEYLRRP